MHYSLNQNNKLKIDYDKLKKDVNTIILDTQFVPNLYKSISNISHVLVSISNTDDDTWISSIDATDEEKKNFITLFQPYVSHIRSFFNKKQGIQGGATITKSANAQSASAPIAPSASAPIAPSASAPIAPNAPNAPSANAQSTNTQSANAQNAQSTTNTKVKDLYGPDNLATKVIDIFDTANKYTHNFASKYGVVKVIEDYDEKGDIPIIPSMLKNLITSGLSLVPGGVAMVPEAEAIMDNLRLSLRSIVFIIYLMLDALRITMSLTGNESSRQLLSVGMAVLELLKGNWKAATLSFMGYFGNTPMLISQYFKIIVHFYDTLADDKKNNIIYGINSTVKSLMVGILLTIFKITAPFEVRKPLIDILHKIKENKDKIDGVLTSEDLPGRPDYLAPSYDDLQNLHALMNDKQFICSCEHRKLITEVNKSSIINIILQLMDIPTTDPVYQYKCDRDKCSSFLDLIVESGLEEKQAKEIAQTIQQELERDEALHKMVETMDNKKEELLQNVKSKMKDANPSPSIDEIKIAVMDVLQELKQTMHKDTSVTPAATETAPVAPVAPAATETAPAATETAPVAPAAPSANATAPAAPSANATAPVPATATATATANATTTATAPKEEPKATEESMLGGRSLRRSRRRLRKSKKSS